MFRQAQAVVRRPSLGVWSCIGPRHRNVAATTSSQPSLNGVSSSFAAGDKEKVDNSTAVNELSSGSVTQADSELPSSSMTCEVEGEDHHMADSYWQDYMEKRSMGNKSVARDIPSILSGGALLEDGYKELHSQDGNEMEIEGGIVGSPKSVAEELGEELLWQHLAQELQRQHTTEGEMSRQVREEEEAVAREIAEEEEHVASTAASELGQVGMQFLLVCQNIIYSCSAELGCLRMAE
jgi:hypothetical protein